MYSFHTKKIFADPPPPLLSDIHILRSHRGGKESKSTENVYYLEILYDRFLKRHKSNVSSDDELGQCDTLFEEE